MIYSTKDPIEKKKAIVYFTLLIDKNKDIEVKAIAKKRGVSNNAYLHVCINLYAIYVGYTMEEAKTVLKRTCSFMMYEKNGMKFLKRTRDLNDKETCDFTEWIRTHSAQVHGNYIPSPTEYKENRIQIDKEISNNKEFL